MKSVRVIVSGKVQGVSFRDACRRAAIERRVRGWVRNRADGSVEAVFEGEPGAVNAMVAWARKGPPAASVTRLDLVEQAPTGATSFTIDI